MSLAEYKEVRADPRHFFNVAGHQVAALGTAVVVEERDRYVIVEKRGHAGDVAEELDDRTLDVADEEAATEEP